MTYVLCIRNGFAIHEDSLRMAADSKVQSELTEAWLTFSLLSWTSHDLFLCYFHGIPVGIEVIQQS